MFTGTVKSFDPLKGQGFIARDEGPGDIFVHYFSPKGATRTLPVGTKVQFEIREGKDGPEATNVVALDR